MPLLQALEQLQLVEPMTTEKPYHHTTTTVTTTVTNSSKSVSSTTTPTNSNKSLWKKILSRKSPRHETLEKHYDTTHDSPTAATTRKDVSVNNQSVSFLQNMTHFLNELDGICDTIESSLLKRSISKKLTDWALQPWSPSKDAELAKVTEGMRQALRNQPPSPLVNPIDSSQILTSIDSQDCFILPSAHFPLLLTFHVKHGEQDTSVAKSRNTTIPVLGEEKLYRTKVQLMAIRGSRLAAGRAYVVQVAVAGTLQESGRSSCTNETAVQEWNKEQSLTFDTRSTWGAPQTLSLCVSTVASGENGQDHVLSLQQASEMGYGWVDINSLWRRVENDVSASTTCHAQLWSLEATHAFDQHGELPDGMAPVSERLELELRITAEILPFDHPKSGYQTRKRMLLYKHDDDLRQEMFAIQFINICGSLLKTAGLDLKLLTFRCIPVGANRGFIEWVPGSVPLSDICQPFAGSILASRVPSGETEVKRQEEDDTRSDVAKSGLLKYQSLNQQTHQAKLGGDAGTTSLGNNPIQEFLRSAAYDAKAPYFIRREVMDNYVKSCAGYCVLTYLLGLGDRHLDNLLLHQCGYFFHCDYSFILGHDPKKYLPMRITEQMVQGMGGSESDNYAMFTSLAGAAFLALRRHENVRVMLSLVRLMAPSAIPDVSVNQTPDQALEGLRERLRLDLSDKQAITFMEQLIEDSVCSKMWIAVDAIHSIGKRF
jgi:phosphatidylinositol 3-kinase